MPPESSAGRLSDSHFLRSINVRLDAAHPDRIAHFRPTAKGLQFVRSLFGDGTERAHLVVAPYGSGKSLAATFLLQLIENRPDARKVLGEIGKRLEQVSPEFFGVVQERKRRKERGLVLALQGHAPSVADALREAATEALRRLGLGRRGAALRRLPTATGEDLLLLLETLDSLAASEGLDRIVVLWDEFGRHLEALVSEGKPGALVDVQLLAEAASRSGDVPLSMGLLLHRGLLHYATNMPQAVLASWKKVEGRFRTLQYVDDSKELYRLAAEVVEARRGTSTPSASIPLAWAARECKARGIFSDFAEEDLRELLSRAYPLEPVTLFLLPRLAARVAQNERTLFGFLHSQPLRQPVSPEALFDYFSPSMQADVGPGGTSRQWLETQSALLKCLDIPGGGRVIKTASLLGLGISGERSRAGRELLLLGMSGYAPSDHVGSVVDTLLARKLLLHRRHSDEVSVWHGTDLDLRTRLEEEKARQRTRLDVRAVLSREAPPPTWRPVEYNDDLGVRRFFDGQYIAPKALATLFGPELSLGELGAVPDGRVLYVLAETVEDHEDAHRLLAQCQESSRHVLAIPREPVPVSEAALEVWSLLQLSRDPELMGSDPFAAAELAQMLDDARNHLQQLVARLVQPSAAGPRWFHKGEELSVQSPRELRVRLSQIMRDVFHKTPRIWNEMIVRHRPSPVVVNARKKLVMGILERAGQEHLGLQGNFPDSSMFRTVLRNTGLYRPSGRGWRFARPDEVADPGLAAVWQRLDAFFTEPQEEPKSVSELLTVLAAPPYGLRGGLVPILMAAALKAFPTSINLSKDGHYLGDILPSEVETLCREPERFRVRVLRLDRGELAYVRGLLELFGVVARSDEAQDLIRLSYDVLEAWKAQLTPGVWSTAALSDEARAFRDALSRGSDPHAFVFRHIPRACGRQLGDVDGLLQEVRRVRDELVGVTKGYRQAAEQAVVRLMNLGGSDAPKGALEVAAAWSACFQEAFVSRLADGVGKALIARAGAEYDDVALLIDSVSSLLVGKTLDRWDDSVVPAFERELQSVVRRVEEAAIADASVTVGDRDGAEALAQLIAARIQELRSRLETLVGSARANAVAAGSSSARVLRRKER